MKENKLPFSFIFWIIRVRLLESEGQQFQTNSEYEMHFDKLIVASGRFQVSYIPEEFRKLLNKHEELVGSVCHTIDYPFLSPGTLNKKSKVLGSKLQPFDSLAN